MSASRRRRTQHQCHERQQIGILQQQRDQPAAAASMQPGKKTVERCYCLFAILRACQLLDQRMNERTKLRSRKIAA